MTANRTGSMRCETHVQFFLKEVLRDSLKRAKALLERPARSVPPRKKTGGRQRGEQPDVSIHMKKMVISEQLHGLKNQIVFTHTVGGTMVSGAMFCKGESGAMFLERRV